MKLCNLKTCRYYGQLLSLDNFNKSNKHPDGLQKHCKSCQHDNYIKNKQKVIKRSLERQKKDPNRKNNVRKYDLKRRFNLSVEEYDLLLKKQNGVCAICNTTVLDKNLAVDHNHKNGIIRGLLCIPCNLLIGNAKENKNILLNAVKYLELYNGY